MKRTLLRTGETSSPRRAQAVGDLSSAGLSAPGRRRGRADRRRGPGARRRRHRARRTAGPPRCSRRRGRRCRPATARLAPATVGGGDRLVREGVAVGLRRPRPARGGRGHAASRPRRSPAAAEQALGGTRFGMSGPRIEQWLTPLMSGGKPEVFYAGSEACPFCGVQRWGMIVALSQFGTFSNLHLMQSVATTPTAGEDVHVLRIELPQPLHLVRSGRGVEQRAGQPGLVSHSPIPSARWCTEFDPSSRDAVHRRRQPLHHGRLDGRSTAHRPQVVDAARRRP